MLQHSLLLLFGLGPLGLPELAIIVAILAMPAAAIAVCYLLWRAYSTRDDGRRPAYSGAESEDMGKSCPNERTHLYAPPAEWRHCPVCGQQLE